MLVIKTLGCSSVEIFVRSLGELSIPSQANQKVKRISVAYATD
jgi:hypothetical protein